MNCCRLLSPKRVACGLTLLAALVVGGLAWVSVTALRVEAAQREADARADANQRQRLALWRLDGFLLPTLGLENNRPYSHYFALYAPAPVALDAAGDPTADPGRVPSPLLSADLPPWMTLHFQLSPERGWESPQVIPLALADKLTNDPFGLFLTNVTDDRARRLAHLRTRFPAADAVRLLMDHERTDPDEEPFLVPVPQADDPILEKPTPLISPDLPPGWTKPSAGSEVACGRGGAWFDVPEPKLANRGESKQNDPKASESANEEASKSQSKAERERLQEYAKRLEDLNGIPIRPTGPTPTQLPPAMQQNLNPRGQTPAETDAAARKNSTDNVLGNRAGYEPGGKLIGLPRGGGVRGGPPTNTADLRANIPAADAKELQKQTAEWSEYFRDGFNRFNKQQNDLQQQVKDKADERKTGDADAGKKAAGRLAGEVKPYRVPDALIEQRGRRLVNDYIGLAKEAGAGPVVAAEGKAGPLVVPVAVHLGPVRPRWLTAPDGTRHLTLVRAAKLNEKTVFQGVLIDWAALKAALLDRIPDLLPDADLTPVPAADVRPEQGMTALPVELAANDRVELPPCGWTPLRSGLVIAWAAAVLAIVAVAFGGRAVVAMSERRVRFASAVTHELRTPLTALQLHLDLLNSGLVTDEGKRAEYLATISAEADRLNRLVENVLDFARLEKRSARATARPVPVATVLESVRVTWAGRLAAEGFELVVEDDTGSAAAVADPRVIVQVLGNLIDNARKYAKSAPDRRVWVRATADGKRVAFTVEDRGPGVPAGERKAVFRPFARGTDTADSGGAGLGLALARQWAELYGGTLTYQPADAPGARFVLELPAA